MRCRSLAAILLSACTLPHNIETDESARPSEEPEEKEFVWSQIRARASLELDGISAEVLWTTTPCPYWEDGRTAVIYEDLCHAGATFSCEEIYVARRESFAASAFAHELGHCARIWEGLGIDRNHQDTDWWVMMNDITKEEDR